MILHDFRSRCGHIFEKMVPWDVESVSCPKCGCNAERVFLPRSERPENAQRFQPVVVFKKRDGTFIFPGRSNERTPKGCERVELRDAHQVRQFERDENRRLKDIHQGSMERQSAHYKAMKREMREQLRDKLSTMSPRGRRLAEFAMQQSDARESHSSRAARFDAGFRVGVFSDDASNRPAFADVDTGWRGRRD